MRIRVGDFVTWGARNYAYPVVALEGDLAVMEMTAPRVEIRRPLHVLEIVDSRDVGAEGALQPGVATKHPTLSWLGFVNYYVLQWFFVRLARVDYPGAFRARALRPVQRGQLVSTSDVDTTTMIPVTSWTVLRWVWPLSGWGKRPYRFIGRRIG